MLLSAPMLLRLFSSHNKSAHSGGLKAMRHGGARIVPGHTGESTSTTSSSTSSTSTADAKKEDSGVLVLESKAMFAASMLAHSKVGETLLKELDQNVSEGKRDELLEYAGSQLVEPSGRAGSLVQDLRDIVANTQFARTLLTNVTTIDSSNPGNVRRRSQLELLKDSLLRGCCEESAEAIARYLQAQGYKAKLSDTSDHNHWFTVVLNEQGAPAIVDATWVQFADGLGIGTDRVALDVNNLDKYNADLRDQQVGVPPLVGLTLKEAEAEIRAYMPKRPSKQQEAKLKELLAIYRDGLRRW